MYGCRVPWSVLKETEAQGIMVSAEDIVLGRKTRSISVPKVKTIPLPNVAVKGVEARVGEGWSPSTITRKRDSDSEGVVDLEMETGEKKKHKPEQGQERKLEVLAPQPTRVMSVVRCFSTCFSMSWLIHVA